MTKPLRDVLAEAAEDAESTRDEAPTANASRRSVPDKEPSAVYSLRIPVDQIERLRALAAVRGTSPSALLREWALERLGNETVDDTANDQITYAAQRLREVADDLERSSTIHREPVNG